jgi:hypothetical protein
MTITDEDMKIIAASNLFNYEWYLYEYPDVAGSGIDPLVHYVQYGAFEGRLPFRGFNAANYLANLPTGEILNRNILAHYILHGSPADLLSKGQLTDFSLNAIKSAVDRMEAFPIYNVEDYLDLNEDVRRSSSKAEIHPTNHAVVFGLSEGRKIFMKTTVARVMGAAALVPFRPLPASVKKSAPLPPIGVFYSSAGNSFIKELAGDIVATLLEAGEDANLQDETSDIASRPPICIYVAPHEFFYLGRGRNWVREDVLRSGLMFTTEQPQTLWFDRSMLYILMSRAVIDIASQMTDVFRMAGIPALHFNPNIAPCTGWLRTDDLSHPLVRVLPKQAQILETPILKFSARSIDISFFGTASEHRERFFTKNAPFFADHDAFLYYRKLDIPLLERGPHAALSRVAGHVSMHSKISLNIHRDDNGFFEWHRIVKLGIASGSVVISEPCPPHPLFKAGTHYLEEAGRHITNVVEWLLKTKDGQEEAQRIQHNALALVSDYKLMTRNKRSLVDFIAEQCGVVEW